MCRILYMCILLLLLVINFWYLLKIHLFYLLVCLPFLCVLRVIFVNFNIIILIKKFIKIEDYLLEILCNIYILYSYRFYLFLQYNIIKITNKLASLNSTMRLTSINLDLFLLYIRKYIYLQIKVYKKYKYIL